MFPRFVCACLLALSIVFCSSTAFAGKFEFTTYYPAPLGEYKNLSSTEDVHFNGVTVGKGAGSVGNNTAVGHEALSNNTPTSGYGTINTAMGYQALYNNTYGYQNTAVGVSALVGNTTGYNNVAIGYDAGYQITIGYNNVVTGYQAGADSLVDLTTQTGSVVLGHATTSNFYCHVGTLVTSDARDKTDFAPVPNGLDFVTKLKPIAYQFKTSRKNPMPQESGKVHYGFLAQDILPLRGDHPVVIDNRDAGHLKFDESSLIPVLVNAIQEQQKERSFEEGCLRVKKAVNLFVDARAGNSSPAF